MKTDHFTLYLYFPLSCLIDLFLRHPSIWYIWRICRFDVRRKPMLSRSRLNTSFPLLYLFIWHTLLVNCLKIDKFWYFAVSEIFSIVNEQLTFLGRFSQLSYFFKLVINYLIAELISFSLTKNVVSLSKLFAL